MCGHQFKTLLEHFQPLLHSGVKLILRQPPINLWKLHCAWETGHIKTVQISARVLLPISEEAVSQHPDSQLTWSSENYGFSTLKASPETEWVARGISSRTLWKSGWIVALQRGWPGTWGGSSPTQRGMTERQQKMIHQIYVRHEPTHRGEKWATWTDFIGFDLLYPCPIVALVPLPFPCSL